MKVYSIEIDMAVPNGSISRWEPWLVHAEGINAVMLTHFDTEQAALQAISQIMGTDPADKAALRIVEHVLLPGRVTDIFTSPAAP